jgi:hypothetical protein
MIIPRIEHVLLVDSKAHGAGKDYKRLRGGLEELESTLKEAKGGRIKVMSIGTLNRL